MDKKDIKIYYIKNESYENFCINREKEITDADVLMFAPGIFSCVNYEDEFSNKSFIFKEIAILSKKFNCIVCAHAETVLKDKKYDSIIVCENGKVLGVSDCTINAKHCCGAELNIFITKIGKIGFACNKDSDAIECLKLLKLYGADLILNIDENFTTLKKLSLDYFYERYNIKSVSLSKELFYVSGQENVSEVLNFGHAIINNKGKHISSLEENKNIYKIIAEKL